MCECLLPQLEKFEPCQGSQLLQLSKMQHQPGDKVQNYCWANGYSKLASKICFTKKPAYINNIANILPEVPLVDLQKWPCAKQKKKLCRFNQKILINAQNTPFSSHPP